MNTMKTVDEELRALQSLVKKSRVGHLPGAEQWLERHSERPRRTIQFMYDVSSGNLPSDFVICMMLRNDELRVSTNVIGRCADCNVVVEHVPKVSPRSVLLCVFCATNRSQGISR